VLGLVIADYVYRTYPELAEGRLTDARRSVVNAASLADVARALELGNELLLGRGEEISGGREKTSILADAFEAVLGAVYLDGGYAAAERLVMSLLGGSVAEAAAGVGGVDYKTLLQELSLRIHQRLPRYDATGSGPDHSKRFVAVVHLGDRALGRGEGRSKKQAEQAAAREAVIALRAEHEVVSAETHEADGRGRLNGRREGNPPRHAAGETAGESVSVGSGGSRLGGGGA